MGKVFNIAVKEDVDLTATTLGPDGEEAFTWLQDDLLLELDKYIESKQQRDRGRGEVDVKALLIMMLREAQLIVKHQRE